MLESTEIITLLSQRIKSTPLALIHTFVGRLKIIVANVLHIAVELISQMLCVISQTNTFENYLNF